MVRVVDIDVLVHGPEPERTVSRVIGGNGELPAVGGV